jgi:hypothetical protein
MAIADILNFVTGILENSPEVLFYVQIIAYILLLLFFGRIVILGYRNYIPGWVGLLLKAATGLVVLFAAITLSSMFTLTGQIGRIINLVQGNILIFGILTSIIMIFAIYLISKNFPNSKGIRNALQRIDHRMERAQQKKPAKSNFEPTLALGVLVILALLLFSVVIFQGYPNLSDRLYSEMGTTQEEIAGIFSLAGNAMGSSDDSDMVTVAIMANQFLPIILPILQIVVYVSFSLFIFGWIASLGLVTHYQRSIKFLIRVGSGFLALFVGISLSPFVIISSTNPVQVILELFQIHILIAGVIASVIIGLGIFLISLNLFSIKGLENDKNKMNKKLMKAQETESKQKGSPLKRPGFLIGLAIVIAMIVVSLYGLGKIPNYSEQFDEVLVEMGMSRQAMLTLINTYKDQASQYDDILEQLRDLPEGCPNITNIEDDISTIMSGAAPLNNATIQGMIEQASGEEIAYMITTQMNGQEIIIGITMNNKACIATREIFCTCIDMPGSPLQPF